MYIHAHIRLHRCIYIYIHIYIRVYVCVCVRQNGLRTAASMSRCTDLQDTRRLSFRSNIELVQGPSDEDYDAPG